MNSATETVRYKDPGSLRAPGLELILEDAFSYEPYVGPLLDSPTATFEVTYTGFTPQARAAFDFALNIWASILSSPVPIKVAAGFQVLPSPNTLAVAGANSAWRNTPTVNLGMPINNTWFIDAIADKLHGSNLETDPTEPDVIATFNSAPAAPWYYGLDARPPAGQVDFVSVVLHELGHGLGFLGSGRVSGAVGLWGLSSSPINPLIYDRYVRAFGFSILSVGSSSPLLLQAYTSNNLFFQSPPTVSAIGPSITTPAKLFAPATFVTGSSYSHLDESTYPAGDANALMTPAINTAEGNHNPGPITAAIFTDSGWGPVGGTPGTPTVTSATGTPGGNVTVVWTLGGGAPPTDHLVQFFQGANLVASVPHGATTTFSAGPIPANIVGDFSVRVQAISGSIPGPFSPLFNFTIGSCPTLTGPIISGGIVNGLGTVAWQAVAGATSYLVSAGTTAGGTQFLAPTSVGSATSVSAGGLPAGFQAFVRVVAVNVCGQQGPSTDFLLK